MKTLSPVTKPGAQLRPETRSPFFSRQTQPGSTFFMPAVQAKLEVSQPGDPHEVEADRMAEHVMRTLGEPFFSPSTPAPSAPVPAISRVSTPPSAATVDEEPVAKEDEEAADSILRMADPWFSGGTSDDENMPASAPIQRRAARLTRTSLAFGALPVSHFAARSRANARKAITPARATISSGWVTRTPARSRPDRARGPPRGGEHFSNLLSQSKGRGQPLSQQSRAEMEPAFGAHFEAVRVHTGDEANRLTNRASALAFAHEGDIYFNRGQFQPDTSPGRRLLAHELTHVVQQGRAVQRSSIQRSPFASSIAARSNHARAPPQISRAEPQVQRLGWSDIKEEINSYAEQIPGFTLMTVVVGYNPILDENVEWTAKNFFRGAAGLIPFGTLLFDKLDEAGVIDSVFNWVTSQIDAHNLTLARVNSLFSQAWDQMDFVRLDPIDYNVGVVRSTFSGILSDVAVFAGACVDKLIEVFKELAIKAVRALFGENAPAYDLICQVLGQDPLTGETREWNTADFLRSVLRLFGFENHLAKMEETGQVEKAAAWLDMQVGLLVSAYSGLIFGIIDLWTSLSLEKLVHPEELLTKTLDIVLTYAGKLALFAFNLATKVLELVKEALITLLKAHVHKVPGYPLFTVVLGMDPVTGEEVPRTPENFLKGFLSFVPKGIETYENIKASGALPAAMAWLLGLINELGLSPSQLLERFLTLWNSFTIDDLMNPIGAFIRIAEAYLSYVADVMMLVLRVYWKVLEIMFVFLLGPGAARVVAALKQGENTFRLIIEDPVGFFGNLLSAIGKGLMQFGSNIWKHIQAGLIGWMLGSLQGAGIEMPEKFDLKGVVSIVMQLLGLTYRQIRPILVKRLGEKVVEGLEKTFEFLRLFLTEGFAGVWRQFLEWVGDLKGLVIQAVTEWVVTKIVMVGLTKLATLWNPVGWVVEAVLAIYNTIMFFIERMEQILDFVEAVIQSINNIATGKLQQAADYVESAMARTIPVIISFCTSLIGLGGISSKIRGVIQKVQDKVHKAIEKMIDWIMKKAKALVSKKVSGEADLTDDDRQKHQKYISEIIETLTKPGKDQIPFEEFYTQKQIEAKGLEKSYGQRVRKGIKVTITFKNPVEKDRKDKDIDLRVTIQPNTEERDVTIQAPSGGETFELTETKKFRVVETATRPLRGAVILQRPRQSGDRIGVAASLALNKLPEGEKKVDVSALVVATSVTNANEMTGFYNKVVANLDLGSDRVGAIAVADARESPNHDAMEAQVYRDFANPASLRFMSGTGGDLNNAKLASAVVQSGATAHDVTHGTRTVAEAVKAHGWEAAKNWIDGGFKAQGDPEELDRLIQDFLANKGVKAKGRYTLMWVKTGAWEREKSWHFTSGDLIKILIEDSAKANRGPVLIGDKPAESISVKRDLTEFWNDASYPKDLSDQGRHGQLAVLNWMSRKTGSLAIGMRSGVLESSALSGIPTFYFEEQGSPSAYRMEQWFNIPTFHRIILDLPPGQKQREVFKEQAAKDQLVPSKAIGHYTELINRLTDEERRELRRAQVAYIESQLTGPSVTEQERAAIGYILNLKKEQQLQLQQKVLEDAEERGLERAEQFFQEKNVLNRQRGQEGQRKARDTSSLAHRAWCKAHDSAKRSSGLSLPSETARLFGSAFCSNSLSRVKIHNDSAAHRASQAVNARAYTFGSDIYFNRGEYEPHTKRGQHLLAHELTHVVQQTRPSTVPLIQRQADPAHDLTSPGLSADPVLEEIFDEKGSLGPSTKSPEVKKVQEALLALGFTLPKFGADGDYGSETRQAVRGFQSKAGLSGAQIDGIVGPVTLGLLDCALCQGSVHGMNDLTTEATEKKKNTTG
jgi:hypothetical protein